MTFGHRRRPRFASPRKRLGSEIVAKRFKGVINIDIRDSVPDWEPYAQPIAPGGRAERALHRPRRCRLLGDGAVRRADRDAEHQPHRRQGPDATRTSIRRRSCSPTRSCLLTGRNHTTERHGLHHRGGRRLPRLERAHPVRVRDDRRGARRARLEHLHARQVASDRRGRDEHGLAQAQLAARARLRALLRLPRRRDQPVVSRPGLRQPSGRAARQLAGGGLPPHRRPDRQGDRVHPRRQGDRARQAVLHVLLPRRLPRAAPRAQGVDRQVQGQVRHGLREVPRAGLRAPEAARNRDRTRPSCRRSTRTSTRRAPTARAGPSSTWSGPGTRCPTTRRICSAAWPRCTPASSATPTTRSGGCSTTSRRPASSTTRSIVLVSDNGASGEGGPNGSVNENKFFNGLPDLIEENLKFLDDARHARRPTTTTRPAGRARSTRPSSCGSATQLGGRHGRPDARLLAQGHQPKAGVRRQYIHAIDIVPTIYECLGVEPPEVVKGYTQYPLEGISFKYDLRGRRRARPRRRRSSSRCSARAPSGTRAGRPSAIHPTVAGMWADFATQRWELYNTENDPSECHDLAARAPGEAAGADRRSGAPRRARYGALPLEDRTAVEILTTQRPQLAKPRDRYIYYPDGAEVPESVAVEHPQPLVHDRRRGRRSTPRRPAACCSRRARASAGTRCTSRTASSSTSTTSWGSSEQVDRVDRDGADSATSSSRPRSRRAATDADRGHADAAHARRGVGEGQIKTQPGFFSLAGEGLNIGRDGGEPVTDDYPGDSPWEFVGGTIHQAIIDVSGETFVDLAREARMAFARD